MGGVVPVRSGALGLISYFWCIRKFRRTVGSVEQFWETDAPDQRQFDAKVKRIDAAAEAKHIYFESFDAAHQQTQQPEQRNLEAAAARRPAHRTQAKIVLANGVAGEFQFEFWHDARKMGDEGI